MMEVEQRFEPSVLGDEHEHSVGTSVASLMVGVFAIFATLGWMLRATMTLLGDRNWYLPGWLEWLPRVSHEEPVTPPLTEMRPRVPVGV